jgi:RNA polymerase sigma-70 factor (ECF subfamily)
MGPPEGQFRQQLPEPRFRQLYEQHYRAILAYSLRRCRNDADAHDVVAETFLVAWRRLDAVPDDDESLPCLSC